MALLVVALEVVDDLRRLRLGDVAGIQSDTQGVELGRSERLVQLAAFAHLVREHADVVAVSLASILRLQPHERVLGDEIRVRLLGERNN